MVIPPITVEQLARQILSQNNIKPLPSLPQNQSSNSFGAELAKQMGGSFTSGQQTIIVSQMNRQQTFVPLMNEASAPASMGATSNRKSGKNKKPNTPSSSGLRGYSPKR